MGKTKTAFVGGVTDEKLSSEEKYKQKQAKKKAEENKKSSLAEATKDKKKIEGLGLRGGARIKVIGADVPEEIKPEDQKTPEAKIKPASSESDLSEEGQGKIKKIHIRGKNYKNAKAKVDTSKLYNIKDAIKLIKSTSYAKFDETYELHITVKKLGLNLNVNLPHNFGKSKRVQVANDETIEKLKKGEIDFDVLLSTPDMMPKLVSFARLLGPKGLMPNPKNGTIIKNEKDAEKFSVDQKTIKTEKDQPVIHTSVGKKSMKEDEISENVKAILDAITKANIIKVYFKSTMSPVVKLQI